MGDYCPFLRSCRTRRSVRYRWRASSDLHCLQRQCLWPWDWPFVRSGEKSVRGFICPQPLHLFFSMPSSTTTAILFSPVALIRVCSAQSFCLSRPPKFCELRRAQALLPKASRHAQRKSCLWCFQAPAHKGNQRPVFLPPRFWGRGHRTRALGRAGPSLSGRPTS